MSGALVPPSVVAGFSAGIGAIMVISQLNAILDVPGQPSDNSLAQLVGVVRELHAVRLEPLLLATLVVFAAALSSRWGPLLPAPLVGVALAGVAAQLFRSEWRSWDHSNWPCHHW